MTKSVQLVQVSLCFRGVSAGPSEVILEQRVAWSLLSFFESPCTI